MDVRLASSNVVAGLPPVSTSVPPKDGIFEEQPAGAYRGLLFAMAFNLLLIACGAVVWLAISPCNAPCRFAYYERGIHSFSPRLRLQRQFIEFGTSLAPSRVMLAQDGQKPLAVRRLDEMDHFVNDDVFEQALRFRHELRIQPNMPGSVIAASPLGLHPLQEIPRDLHI